MAASTTTWEGNLTQEEFMEKDNCILVTEADVVQGSANKKACHQFIEGQPTGLLHRAFSVFLFDSENRLLLQQRALSKITFPGVWTNTCCSHQLTGMTPDEVDDPSGNPTAALGAAAAAVRKLDQELGIPADQVPASSFKFLTRLHYCAPDTDTHGPDSPWGEHELDYILLIKTPVTMDPNPEEVHDTKYVTPDELRAMMDPASGLKWSPWFRIIAENFLLPQWWAELDAALTTDKFVDGKIHKLSTAA